MKTYEETFTKSERLEFAANDCIDGLEQIVADLPMGGTDEDLRQAIREIKMQIGMLMESVRRIECELENKPINLENMTVDFFNKIAKAGRVK